MNESAAIPEMPGADGQRAQALAEIGQALDSLRFGTILLTVHDSKVVQLEVTEKKRFGR
jgi:hypothetical protein